jgi:hypothetical protein
MGKPYTVCTTRHVQTEEKHNVLCFEINRKDLEERVPLFPGKGGAGEKGVGEGGENPSVFPDLLHTAHKSHMNKLRISNLGLMEGNSKQSLPRKIS